VLGTGELSGQIPVAQTYQHTNIYGKHLTTKEHLSTVQFKIFKLTLLFG
jgi:hypothetical protein